MNKEDLIDAISARTEYTKADTKKFLDALVEVTEATLTAGDPVQLIGFLSLSVVDKPARKGRNPQTGKEITIPARKAVKCTIGKALKEAINSAKPKKKK